MGDNEAGFSEQQVKGKVLKTVVRVPASEDREPSIAGDCNIPHIADLRARAVNVDRHSLRVHRARITKTLEHLRTNRREDTLRENHDSIVMDSRSRLVFLHSAHGEFRLVLQARNCSVTKFGFGVVAAMNRYREPILLCKELRRTSGCSAPIPRNERDIRGKAVLLHGFSEDFEITPSGTRLQQRI